MISTPQTAELLGIARKSVHETTYAYEDFLDPVRVGRTLLFDPDTLRTWREQHSIRPGRIG